MRPSSSLSDRLTSTLRQINKSAQRVDQLRAARAITRTDHERLYEALFLRGFTSFEAFIEELFVGLMLTDAGVRSTQTNVNPRVVVRTHAVARQLINNGRPYVDWLPYKATLDRAEMFFTGGRPFSLVTDSDIDLLRRTGHLRNAISHKSRHSRSQFERQVLASQKLMPRERTPAGYLASRPNIGQTRLEVLLASFDRIARTLTR